MGGGSVGAVGVGPEDDSGADPVPVVGSRPAAGSGPASGVRPAGAGSGPGGDAAGIAAEAAACAGTEAVTPTGPRPAAPPAPAGPAAVDAAGTGAAASDERPVPSSPHLTTVPSTTPPWTESAPDATTAPPATTGPRPGDVAREALRAARAQARRDPSGAEVRSSADAPAEAAGQPAHEAHERAARRRRHRPGPDPGARSFALPAGRSADVPRADHTRDRVAEERARAVRELLADSFRMPADDTAEPESVPEPEPVSEPGCRPVPAPATTRASEPVRGTCRDHTEDGPEAPDAPEGPYAPDGREDHAFSLVLDDVPPHTPRSMAAPSRDGDHRRTFPAFPPRTGGDFAGSWWGNAWVAALEEGALDPKRVLRGRGYAEQGNVDAITVTPGHVLAYVQGSRPRPYRVQVRLRTFGEEDWERFLAAAVEHPGHIAALLDKEMPESLAECGVPLLPGPGDLEPHCSCPDRGHPCKHAAALCYQTARLLDADPFVLLLLRGRGERELLDALSRRNAARAARAAQERQPRPLPGVRAAEVLAERRLPPLPAPLPAPAHPEQPPVYPSAPNGPDSFALDHLATDAAARAHALLTTGNDEIGALTLWQDAVRLAASRPGSGLTAATRALYASLASAAGRTPSELARAVAAWRQGGPDGLAVLEESWDPPAGRFDRARPLLLAADLPAFRPRRNHLTHPRGHVQLRFGRDGLWYAYESEPGHDDWWPRGTPDPDPVGALTGLGGSGGF
ncbi:SWIM zinc finger family protein [Streptomyces sp. NPDC012616]|uniref:SWIM zinc finger family protein n=1 Tax=Streptomyces sp. NPDC012616 TaxID=3364840 RepID=UPI0036E5A795